MTDLTTHVVAEATVQHIARELADIMVTHLAGLTEADKRQRIQAGRAVLEAIKTGKDRHPHRRRDE